VGKKPEAFGVFILCAHDPNDGQKTGVGGRHCLLNPREKLKKGADPLYYSFSGPLEKRAFLCLPTPPRPTVHPMPVGVRAPLLGDPTQSTGSPVASAAAARRADAGATVPTTMALSPSTSSKASAAHMPGFPPMAPAAAHGHPPIHPPPQSSCPTYSLYFVAAKSNVPGLPRRQRPPLLRFSGERGSAAGRRGRTTPRSRTRTAG